MSSPSVGETAHRVGASETHASPGSSPKKHDVYRFPSPRVEGMDEDSPTRSISPSWSPSTGRMVDSRRNSPAVPSSPLVNAESQGLVICDDQRVPVATIANEMNVGAPFVSLSTAKEALDGDDLKLKYTVLRRLQDRLVARGSIEEQEAGDVLPFMESMAAVCQALKLPGLGTLRMVELMCSIASTLACLTGPGFTDPASKIVPELLHFLRIPETGVRKTVSQSVETVLEECPATSTLHAATASLLDAKNPYLRRKGSRFLCFILDKWPEEALRVSRSLIMDQIRKAMVDSDANVRREGRSTFGAFVRLWPAEGVRMYNALDSSSQRATLQEQPFVSNFVGGETFPSCEEGNPMESNSLTPKAWNSPGCVGPSPASFGRAYPGGIRRVLSPTRGAVRSASRLPSLRSISKGSCDAGKVEGNSMSAAKVTISPSRSLSSEESGLETDHDEEDGCGITPGELRRSLMGKDDELPSPWLQSNSLPRCVDAHLAVDLPSRRLVRASSPRTFRGEPSKVTAKLAPSRSPVSGGMPPRVAGRSATRRVRFSPYKEECDLPKISVTPRAIIDEDAVAIAKVEGGQHARKMPCMLLVLLMAFITAVIFGVFGIVFLSMGKLPRGVIRAIHGEAGVFPGTADALSQMELEVSVESLGACVAAINVGAATSKDDGDGTSGSEISEEYDLAFSEGLATGSTPDRASAAGGDVYDVPLADDQGEAETSNQQSSQRIHHMVEDSDIMSAAPGQTDPEEPMSPTASDESCLVRDIDTFSANPDRVNPGESMPLAVKSSSSFGLVEPGEPPSRPDTEDGHSVGDADTVSLSPGLEDLGEFLSCLALDDICLMVSAVTFALVVIWIAGVKSRLVDDGTVIDPSGVCRDVDMSTPPRRNAKEGTHQEEEELGCYNKIEVIKNGNSPGTVRSVKRSRRIESAKKAQNTRKMRDEIG